MSAHRAGLNERPDWVPYFLGIAEAVAARGDCSRAQVGAILVDRLGRIRGTGYNGARPGGPSCLKGECPRGRQTYAEVAPLSSYDTGSTSCVAIHAEMNVILFSSSEDRDSGSIYVTRETCDGCLRIVQGSGVERIVWCESIHGPAGRWVKQGNGDWKRFDGTGA